MTPDLRLVPVPELDCGTGSGNMIIEGDNLDALMHLMPQLQGAVKVVYIDPPYNTGNSGMGYRDARGRAEWQEFMLPRLYLGLRTLRPDGVMLISIDEPNWLELHQVVQLALRHVGQGLQLAGKLIWRKRTSGGNAPRNLLVVHEYVFIITGPEFAFRTPTGEPLSSYALTPRNDVERAALSGEYVIPAGPTGEGTKLLRDMDITGFSYPKPLSLIQGLVEVSTDPHAGDLVLDFFAGSGTTGHAVLAQNARDGGDRQFILSVLGQEEGNRNVARDVCARRVRLATEGYTPHDKRPVPGLGGGFTYWCIDTGPALAPVVADRLARARATTGGHQRLCLRAAAELAQTDADRAAVAAAAAELGATL